MRTFPKSLATFRRIVDKRGEELRALTWEEIKARALEPMEHIEVESRPATISVIAEPVGEQLRVVVQGFMKHKLFPGSSVALDGFYKHRDGHVTPMPHEEFYRYD
jgi:hypothetical protein